MLPHCSFYFLRHGVTDHNQRRVVMGQMDIPLNDQGRRQAEAAGQLLARAGVDRIATSPLSRALETAQIVGRLCGGTEPELVKDLSERDWGALTGRSHRELFKLPPDATPVGAETPLIFSTRVISAVATLTPHGPQQRPILLVAHAGACRVLRRHMGLDDGQAPVPNAIPVLFSAEKDGTWREIRVA
jgi:probable phosphoglycerate mutase